MVAAYRGDQDRRYERDGSDLDRDAALVEWRYERPTTRYNAYYRANRERIKQKNLARYHRLKRDDPTFAEKLRVQRRERARRERERTRQSIAEIHGRAEVECPRW